MLRTDRVVHMIAVNIVTGSPTIDTPIAWRELWARWHHGKYGYIDGNTFRPSRASNYEEVWGADAGPGLDGVLLPNLSNSTCADLAAKVTVLFGRPIGITVRSPSIGRSQLYTSEMFGAFTSLRPPWRPL
jgi:hypothetical protein